MTAAILLALVAGLVTILNPCILPLLPILIASSLGQNRFGPLAFAAGLTGSFASFGFVIVAFGFELGVDEQLVRYFAGSLLIVAGALLLIPQAQAALTAAASPLTGRASLALSRVSGSGLHGQFLVGLLLGLTWAPCVGPTLGAAIAAASQGQSLTEAFATFLAFGAGVFMSIILFAYGSRKALGGRAKMLRTLALYAKPIFGGALIVVGSMVVTGLDRQLESGLLSVMPSWAIDLTTRY